MVIGAGTGWEEITMIIGKAFLGAAVALAIAMPATAQAQCPYRMNDVGRSHGYLSGPCNGAAQGYSGAYPTRRTTWYRRDGSVSPHDPSLRTVRHGNAVYVYDGNGRLSVYGSRRGNTVNFYNAHGRHIGRGMLGPNGATLYDARGRFVSSSPDVRSEPVR
jgi:hypothetical protein